MKKTILVLLSAVLVVAMALALVACNRCDNNGHQWEEVITKAPTCGDKGVLTRTCNVCGASETEEIAATGNHVWGAWGASSTAGKEERECSVCHQKDYQDIQATECKHTPVNVPAKAPDCTNAGNIEYWKCSKCNRLFSDSNATTEIQLADTVREADPAAHNYGTLIPGQTAEDCTEESTVDHFQCSICKKYFDADKKEISTIVIPASHTLGTPQQGTPATCTVAGSKDYYECSVCHKKFADEQGTTDITDDMTIAALGHDYTGLTWTANPEEVGKHYMDCKRECGEAGARKTENCQYGYVIDGDQHKEVCSECGHVKSSGAHSNVDGKCVCGKLYTEFDVTSFEDLYELEGEDGKWFAIGIVTSIVDSDNNYRAQITIVDENGNVFQTFGLRNEDGTLNYPVASTILEVGDVIVIYGGGITEHEGVMQMTNAWLVQIKGEAKINVAGILLAETEIPSLVNKNFELPTSNGQITWIVVEGEGIDIVGNIAKVTRAATDQKVVLKATATVDQKVAEREFTVVVLLKLEGKEIVAITTQTLMDGLNEGYHKSGDATINDVEFSWIGMGQYGWLQWRTNSTTGTSTVWNTTAFSGKILKIEFVWEKSQALPTKADQLKVELADNSNFTNAKSELITLTSGSAVLDLSSDDYTYVRISHNNKGAVYLEKILITYEVLEPACAHEHLTKTDGRAATCFEAGYEAYWTCDNTECGKKFRDEHGTNPIDEIVTLPKLEHDFTWVKTATEHYQTCSRDCCAEQKFNQNNHDEGKYGFNNEQHWAKCETCGWESEDKADHKYDETTGVCVCGDTAPTHEHKMAPHVEAKAESCTEDGNVAYYQCTECHRYFEDEEGQREITGGVVIPKHHTIKEDIVNGTKGADCKTQGTVAHYECEKCDKWFADKNAQQEIEGEDRNKGEYGDHAYVLTHNEGKWTHTEICSECQGKGTTSNCDDIKLSICQGCKYEYTAEEIVAALYAIPTGSETNNQLINADCTWKLTGVVKSIDTPYSESNGNITVTIEVAGKNVQCYRMKCDQEQVAQIVIGAQITVTGVLKCHYSTREFDTGCQVTNITLLEYSITVNAENATVKSNGQDIVSKAQAGTTITFTVEAVSGYTVVSVKVNGSTVTDTDGVYTLVVTGAMTIDVAVKPEGAADPVIFATFEFGANDTSKTDESKQDGSSITDKTGIYTEDNNGYTLTITNTSKVSKDSYDAKGNSCLKLGTGSIAGSFEFTVPSDVVKVVIYVAGYKNNSASISINGGVNISISGRSANGSYDAIDVDTSTNKKVTFAVVDNTFRCKIDKIEFWGYAPVICEHETILPQDGKEPTCFEDGWDAYWQCQNPDCRQMFSDNGQTPIEEKVVKKAPGSHDYTNQKWAPLPDTEQHFMDCTRCGQTGRKTDDCNDYGWGYDKDEHWITCSECGNDFGKELTEEHHYDESTGLCEECGQPEPAHEHSMNELVSAKEATCTEQGNVDYYYCTTCFRYYEDQAGEHEIEGSPFIAAHHTIKDEIVEAVKGADCKHQGTVAHYECEKCDKWFEDKAAQKELVGDARIGDYGDHSYPEQWTHGEEFGKHYKDCATCNEAGVRQAGSCTIVNSKCGDYRYSDKDVVDALYALASGSNLTGTFELTGVITNIIQNDSKYTNSTVMMKVDGRDVEAFRMVNGSDTDCHSVVLGATITVRGTLTNYNGTYEFEAGCVLFSIERTEYSITWDIEGNGDKGDIADCSLSDRSKAQAGTEVTFKVSCEEGWQVGEVKVNGSPITAENNVYKFTVTGAMTIEVVFADANAKVAEILQSVHLFNDATDDSSLSSYMETYHAKNSDNFELTMYGFSTNKHASGWGNARAGRNNAAGQTGSAAATISTSNSVEEIITKVVVCVDSVATSTTNLGKINFFKLIVASDEGFTQIVEEVTVNLQVGDNEFAISASKQATNLYYRIVLDTQQTSANGCYWFSTVSFWGYAPEREKYPVNIKIDNQEGQGSYTTDPDISSDINVEEKTEITLKVTANENWKVASVTLNGEPLEVSSKESASVWVYKFKVTATNNIEIKFEEDTGTGGGEEERPYTYTLTPTSGSNNSYDGNCDITVDGIVWNLTGNSQMSGGWRFGGKSISNKDRELYSKTAMNANISKIDITFGAASSITVNSLTLIVSKNADFSSPVSTLNNLEFKANSTVTVNRPDGADWTKCYYKIVLNVTVSVSSNKYVELTKMVFTGVEA